MGGVLFYIGEIKNFAFFKLENLKKCQKINGKFIVFGKFSGNLRFFKILSKFSRKFMEILRKLWKYGFVWGFEGGGPP